MSAPSTITVTSAAGVRPAAAAVPADAPPNAQLPAHSEGAAELSRSASEDTVDVVAPGAGGGVDAAGTPIRVSLPTSRQSSGRRGLGERTSMASRGSSSSSSSSSVTQLPCQHEKVVGRVKETKKKAKAKEHTTKKGKGRKAEALQTPSARGEPEPTADIGKMAAAAADAADAVEEAKRKPRLKSGELLASARRQERPSHQPPVSDSASPFALAVASGDEEMAANSLSTIAAPQRGLSAAMESSVKGAASKCLSWDAYLVALRSRLLTESDAHVCAGVAKIREKVKRILQAVCSQFLMRDEAAGVCLMAVLCRQHAFLYSAPGEAKTALVECIMQHMSATGFDPEAENVNITFDASTFVDEIAGFRSIVDFKQDRIRYVRNNTLCGDHTYFAFIDEVWKAHGATLQVLLNLIHERVFKKEGRRILLPLFSLFCASNELPVEAELQAVFDRIVFRVFLTEPPTKDMFEWLKNRSVAARADGSNEAVEDTLTVEDVGFLHVARRLATSSSADWLHPKTPTPDRVWAMLESVVAYTDTFGEVNRATAHQDVRGGFTVTTRRKCILWETIWLLSTFYGRAPHPFDLLVCLYTAWRRHADIAQVHSFVVKLLRRAMANEVNEDDYEAELKVLDGCFLLPSDVIAEVKLKWSDADEAQYSGVNVDKVRTAALKRANAAQAALLADLREQQHEEQQQRDLQRENELVTMQNELEEVVKASNQQEAVAHAKAEAARQQNAAARASVEQRKQELKAAEDAEELRRENVQLALAQNALDAREAANAARKDEATNELRELIKTIQKSSETSNELLEQARELVERGADIGEWYTQDHADSLLSQIVFYRLPKLLLVVLTATCAHSDAIIDLDARDGHNFTTVGQILLVPKKEPVLVACDLLKAVASVMKSFPTRFRRGWSGLGVHDVPGGFLSMIVGTDYFDAMLRTLFSIPFFRDGNFQHIELNLPTYNRLPEAIKPKFKMKQY